MSYICTQNSQQSFYCRKNLAAIKGLLCLFVCIGNLKEFWSITYLLLLPMRKRIQGRLVVECTAKGTVRKLDYQLLKQDVDATLSCQPEGEYPHETFTRLRQEAHLCYETGCLGLAISILRKAITVLTDSEYNELSRQYMLLALDAAGEADAMAIKLFSGKCFFSALEDVYSTYLDILYLRCGE